MDNNNKIPGKLLWRETLLAGLFITGLSTCILLLPIVSEKAEQLIEGNNDFEIYDTYFWDVPQNHKRDTSIVLVQIPETRTAIANLLEKINGMHPAVIGIDALFEPRQDTASDRLLKMLERMPAAVYAYRFDSATNKTMHARGGYLDFDVDNPGVIRQYYPFIRTDKREFMSFTSRVMQEYSITRFAALRQRNKKIELIKYSLPLDGYPHFTADDLEKLSAQVSNIIKGKIVLLGFFSENPVILEDLRFTPCIRTIEGRTGPDMYGIVIHANILSMVLSGNYGYRLPVWSSFLIGYFLILPFLWFIIKRHLARKRTHFIIWGIQLISIVFWAWLFLLLFTATGWKVPLIPIVAMLVISAEMFDVYALFVKWLNKKWRFKTLFTHETTKS